MSDEGLLYAITTIEKLNEYGEKKEKEYHHVCLHIQESIWKIIEDIAENYGIPLDDKYDGPMTYLCNIVDDEAKTTQEKQKMILDWAQEVKNKNQEDN